MLSNIKAHFVQIMQIPPEMAYRLPDIELYGNRKIFIENYRALIHYTEHEIQLKLSDRSLRICGDHLTICEYSKDSMTITGQIQEVSFQ